MKASFVIVIDDITEQSADDLLDELATFLVDHGYPEIPVLIPWDVIEQIGGDHDQD